MRWWQLKKRDEDLERELRSDLELEEEEQREHGASPEEARYAARRAFGNTTLIREQTRGAWGWAWWENVSRDFRYGFRQLRRSPGFAVATILTLALGIGASTSIFSVAYAVLLRPLQYTNPQQIVRIWEQAPNGHRMNIAQKNFEDFQTQNGTFASLAEYESQLTSIVGGSEPVRATVAGVSRGFFQTLGVEPVRGREFTLDEQRPHGAPAVIVSYSYWTQSLGGAADLSKSHLGIEGTDYPVVGVMPAEFDYPAGAVAWISSEVDPDTSSRTAHNWRGIGRLRDGVILAQAQADLSAIAHRLKAAYGKEVDLNDAAIVPLADAIVGNVRSALLLLLGAVGLMLVVTCANVAGLLFARTHARSKELAVRTALGASRGRLIQQSLAESFTLAVAAGASGVLLAGVGVRALPAILPADLPRQEGIAINGAVLLFALAATIAVAVSLGLFTAWRVGVKGMQKSLAAGSRAGSGSLGSQRLRSFLVVGEIATTLVVLVGAGLLGRSFLELISTSPGFRTEGLITMEFSFPQASGATEPGAIARQVNMLDDLMSRLGSIPGAGSVGLISALPVAAGDNLADGDFLILHGQEMPTTFEEWGRMHRNPDDVGHALFAVANGGYFRTLGIPVIRGRLFGEQDNFDSPNVAVISQTLAHERWPNQDPIGKLINFGNMDGNLKPLTIVGIVGDIRARGLDLPPAPIIYVDYSQRGMQSNVTPTVLMRTAVSEGSIDSPARTIFHNIVPDAPVKFSSFGVEMGGWLADRRFLLLLVSFFAAVSLALAAIGLYGVIAFFVARRSQEIGIRMAIGAQRSDVLRMVIGEAARLVAIGIAIGVAASLGITRLLSSFLYGIHTTDPLTFVAVALLLCFVAIAASYIPARRATRVDPVTALRYE